MLLSDTYPPFIGAGRPDAVVVIGVRDDDGFKTPAPRGNLIGQLLGLAYPKLAIDEDRLAFSIDQGRRYIPAIGPRR